MIANVNWRVLGLPLALVALVAGIDCSSSSGEECPQALSGLDLNAGCSYEGLICPYVGDAFDVSRSNNVYDCFGGFVEYTCTQKKWTLTAQAASTPCTIDGTGAVSATTCSIGVGRCAVAATSLACQSTCDAGSGAYGASCVAGQFVVAPISCTGSSLDAGSEEDAATTDDASTDDDAASDAGDD